MIIYSVTISLNKSMADEWISWMQETHIPDVMATGYFDSSEFNQLLDPVVDANMATFNIQYRCRTEEHLQAYQKEAAPALQKAHTDRYKDQFIAFRTTLKRLS
ncbi:MAG: DUF4286 family protein [Bacteroidota bacterium]